MEESPPRYLRITPLGAHPVHATMEESVALARRLRPRRTLLVGMGHAMDLTYPYPYPYPYP